MSLRVMNHWPTVVPSFLDNIHFVAASRPVEATRAVFSFKQEIRSRLPIYSLRIAMTIGPDFRPSILLPNERIIRRNRAVIIHPQYFSRQRIEPLSKFTLSRVTSCNVKLSVRPKAQAAPSMKLSRRDVVDNYRAFGKSPWSFPVTNHPHALSVALVCIGKIKQTIAGKLRVQRNAH